MTDHVDITIVCENTPFETRISKDGDLEFLNYDINYDILAASLGEEETSAIKLLNKWEEHPTAVIGRESSLWEGEYENGIIIGTHLTDRVRFMLSTDFCKHTEEIYINQKPWDKRRIEEIFNTLYLSPSAEGKRKKLEEIEDIINQIMLVVSNKEEFTEINHWVHGLRRTYKIHRYDLDNYQILDVARSTRLAYAFYNSAYASQDFEKYLREEEAWQIRRFIDVVAAYQENKPIPDVEETT